ncbi:MAG: hypothetical protein ACKN9I_02495, partial [Alphaproteobacteria bacterium]
MQIQSARSTAFAIIFMLFSSVVLSVIVSNIFPKSLKFDGDSILSCVVRNICPDANKLDAGSDNHLSGLGDIMIGIGGALMALSIFVYESIINKKNYFNKYFLGAVTNAQILTIFFFLGIFLLLVIYAFSEYVSFVKEIEILLYCFTSLIIIYLIIRLWMTYISFLIKKKYVKYAKELIQNLGNDHNFKEEDGPFNNIIELFDDFCEETLDKLKSENHNLSSDWKIILEFYKNIIEEDNKYNIYDILGTFNFLKTYLHYIPTSIDHASYYYLISHPRKIFEIILEKNYLIKKNDFEFSNRFQNYLYYYQAMYH